MVNRSVQAVGTILRRLDKIKQEKLRESYCREVEVRYLGTRKMMQIELAM